MLVNPTGFEKFVVRCKVMQFLALKYAVRRYQHPQRKLNNFPKGTDDTKGYSGGSNIVLYEPSTDATEQSHKYSEHSGERKNKEMN